MSVNTPSVETCYRLLPRLQHPPSQPRVTLEESSPWSHRGDVFPWERGNRKLLEIRKKKRKKKEKEKRTRKFHRGAHVRSRENHETRFLAIITWKRTFKRVYVPSIFRLTPPPSLVRSSPRKSRGARFTILIDATRGVNIAIGASGGDCYRE